MTTRDWNEIGDLLAEALEQPVAERARFVEERCGGRADLLAAVNRLLIADQMAGAEFLSGLDPALLDTLHSEADAPEQVGPYRLLHPIGAGGMGKVYLAERADGQFERRVAVKLLKRGMDSDAVLARFLRERQILAGLDHPHIARLLDGGIAEDGRPFFVMELVEGQPINQFCERHALTIDQRVGLVRTVCRAVEYAHRSLVVHRDLKPSNILVTEDGQPKLLDFGIAKLLPAPETDAGSTTLTRSGGRLLTPEYAAPEQFSGEPVTTSTDVYSMGAVLFELLAGVRPFPDRSRGETGAMELDREPPLASSRASTPERRRQLAGDLDLILARSLASRPERRYPSIEGLREDLRRYQERLPVQARPDSLGYRASRFVRRHRTAVLLSSAFGALIVLFAILAAMQALRIGRQSRELTAERDRARREATTARAVTDFLVEVFRVSDPQIEGGGDVITARALLDRGAERIEAGMAGRPELQASMLGAMGRAYANLEERDRAETLLLRGVELWRSEQPGGGPELVAALQHLAEVRTRMRDYAAAEQSLREALAMQARIDSSPASRWSLYVDLASSLHGLGAVDRARAAADTALTLYRGRRLDQANDGDLGRLADLMLFTRQWDEMESVYARLVSLESNRRGPRSAAVALLYNKWAAGQTVRGERRAADSLMRISLAIHQELDPGSIGTARTMALLAANALHLSESVRAESLYREALGIYRKHLGDQHPTVAGQRATLAGALRLLGKHEEAIAEYRRAIEGYHRAGGPALTLVPGAEWRLAVALRDGRRPLESLAPFRRALADFEQRYPPDFLSTAQLRRDYGGALLGARRPHEAEQQLRAAVAVFEKRFGPEDPQTDAIRITLGQALAASGRSAQADSMLAEVERRLAASRGASDTLAQRARTARESLRRSRTPG